jgi:hypothetical protein
MPNGTGNFPPKKTAQITVLAITAIIRTVEVAMAMTPKLSYTAKAKTL